MSKEWWPWFLTWDGLRFLFDDSRCKDKTAGNYFGRVICRARGHPAGVAWYNAGGLEPDMTCRYCGEDLG